MLKRGIVKVIGNLKTIEIDELLIVRVIGVQVPQEASLWLLISSTEKRTDRNQTRSVVVDVVNECVCVRDLLSRLEMWLLLVLLMRVVVMIVVVPENNE